MRIVFLLEDIPHQRVNLRTSISSFDPGLSTVHDGYGTSAPARIPGTHAVK